jgi:DnaK suppressor protein
MNDQDYSPEFIDEMRQALEAKRAELVNRSKLARNELRDRDDSPGDSIDESNEEQGMSTELRLKDRDRHYMSRINDALERIEDGDYGYCEVCYEPIGEGRLRARPAALLCIEHKEEAERKERRHHAKNPGMFSPVNRS